MTFVDLISSNSAGGRINNSMDLFLINKDTQLVNVNVENWSKELTNLFFKLFDYLPIVFCSF